MTFLKFRTRCQMGVHAELIGISSMQCIVATKNGKNGFSRTKQRLQKSATSSVTHSVRLNGCVAILVITAVYYLARSI